MHQLILLIESLLRECFKDEIASAKVYAYRKLAKIAAYFFITLTILLIVLLMFVALSIFITIAIGEATGSYALGTLFTLFFDALTLFLLHYNRRQFRAYLTETLFRYLLSKDQQFHKHGKTHRNGLSK